MTIANAPFRLESQIARAWYRLTRYRPSSAPFISGDSFRALADHVFEPGRTFAPKDVRSGDVVFVQAWEFAKFAQTLLGEIKEPFVLITHNGDRNMNESCSAVADDGKIIHWFAQNALVRHPKITPIPIGLENRNLHYNGVVRDFQKIMDGETVRRPRILVAFSVETNRLEREPALAALRPLQFADIIQRTNSRAYRKILRTYCYVASPPGNGVDCHRTWEALYLGVIPIVKKSVFFDSFPGLPALAINDWSEIAAWKEDYLASAYQDLAPRIDDCDYLRFDYWAGRIKEARKMAPRNVLA